MRGARAGRTKDGKSWWHQQNPIATSAQCHLNYWKVVFVMSVCLPGLVDAQVLAEGGEESRSTALMALKEQSQPSWASLYDSSLEDEGEEYRSRWHRSSANAPVVPVKPRKDRRSRKRPRENPSPDCRLEKKQMRVRDLGLGYDSDEIVLFKYCVGTCLSARKNYDMALKMLTEGGSIAGRDVSTQPCCRPVRYETVSFMDAKTNWQTIRWLSAANCSCVG